MQTPDKKLFRDMQEHPEKYSDQEVEAMMDDLDQMPDVDMAWQRLCENEELGVKSEKFATAHPTAQHNSQFRKMAASVIGVIMVSAIALAAIYSLTPGSSPKERGVYRSGVEKTEAKTDYSPLPGRGAGGEATIIFDNVPLDTMLNEMASYYRIAVEFQREEARQLRLHFEWKHDESLDRVLERLNNFEAVNIIREPEKLIVR